MRAKFLVLVVCVVAVAFEGTMADFDGLIDIDEDSDYPVSKNSERSKAVDRFNGGGEDDEDDYGSVMSDESGSGSGNETVSTTDIDFKFITSTPETTTEATEKTTTLDNKITDSSEEPSETPVNVITDDPGIDGEEGTDDDVLGGGVNSETDPNEDDSPNAEALVGTKSVLTVLTTEVIAAVVVGAVCAVILIAFLVYRLRKRDEGSYALSDAGYKDTYKLQGDTGKEAFV